MPPTTNHPVRILDQEIDTVEICPSHQDYIVVGTYSLTRNEPCSMEESIDEESTAKPDTPHRIGSLQVLPIYESDDSQLGGNFIPYSTRQDFPCAILDIRFHPRDNTLLGAATSTGELRFFRFVWHQISTQPDPKPVQILPLGVVRVYSDDGDDGEPLPLITQFDWIDEIGDPFPHNDPAGEFSVRLTTCDTAGQVKMVSVRLPPTSSLEVSKFTANSDRSLVFQAQDVHKHLHNLEAWTISSVAVKTDSNESTRLILSGGDDSCLIASLCTLLPSSQDHDDVLSKPPLRVLLDRRTHTAGVVSILPLDTTTSDGVTILLTGSYDQHLRLHLLDSNMRVSLASEIQLEGGVWRVSLMDRYTDSSEPEKTQNWILLVSAMHAGCYIVRLTAKYDREDQMRTTTGWDWKIEENFREPHESMVYASAARSRQPQAFSQTRTWTIITTSFYDKRICVWEWADTRAPQDT